MNLSMENFEALQCVFHGFDFHLLLIGRTVNRHRDLRGFKRQSCPVQKFLRWVVLKSRATLKASGKLGAYFSVSIAFIYRNTRRNGKVTFHSIFGLDLKKITS